jgi:hypothetical protein
MADITLSSILPYVFTIAGILLAWFLGKRKDNADISAEITQTALNLIKPLKDQIAEQDKELKKLRSLPDHVARLERIIIAYQEGTEKLLKQFKKHNIEPEWEPSPFLLEEVKR